MAKASKSGLTPFMQQYFDAKSKYPDALLFFRMGDFYEIFHEDAVDGGGGARHRVDRRGGRAAGEEIPMAGVPHHAAAGYLARLLEQGTRSPSASSSRTRRP